MGTVAATLDGQTLTITVVGAFDFHDLRAFNTCFGRESEGITDYVVDLANTTYIDSSALAMLLLLRDHAGGDSDRVQIRLGQTSSDVRKLLQAANFDSLFMIL